MPKHVKKMLDGLKNNGADDNIKAIMEFIISSITKWIKFSLILLN